MKKLVAILFCLPFAAYAHNQYGAAKTQTIFISGCIIFTLWLAYSIGAFRVRPKFSAWAAFQVGSLVALLTIFGRLDKLAEISTAAHMTQHMLMMTVIAPLWAISRPLPQWASILGQGIVRVWTPMLYIARYPVLAAGLHAALIWIWHAPKLYNLALAHPWWHVFQHTCFLLSAGIFWWSVLRSNYHAAPRAFMALLFTLMHTGFLGALLTFANFTLYKANGSLESQQLAGLLMWVMGSFPYFLAAIWCGLRWFPQMLRRSEII